MYTRGICITALRRNLSMNQSSMVLQTAPWPAGLLHDIVMLMLNSKVESLAVCHLFVKFSFGNKSTRNKVSEGHRQHMGKYPA